MLPGKKKPPVRRKINIPVPFFSYLKTPDAMGSFPMAFIMRIRP